MAINAFITPVVCVPPPSRRDAVCVEYGFSRLGESRWRAAGVERPRVLWQVREDKAGALYLLVSAWMHPALLVSHESMQPMNQRNCVQINVSWNKNSAFGRRNLAAAYVLYTTQDEAWNCIQSVDGEDWCGNQVRACYGTNKYCQLYLKKQPCTSPHCSYLHEPGVNPHSS